MPDSTPVTPSRSPKAAQSLSISRILRILLICGVVIIVALVAIWYWPGAQSSNRSANDGNANGSTPSLFVNAVPAESTPTDSDGDGLSDEEESSLGTSVQAVDTDGDGLYDYEEVHAYESDPRNPDSDDDGFEDGDEVLQGFNPNGDGNLRDLTNALTNQSNL